MKMKAISILCALALMSTSSLSIASFYTVIVPTGTPVEVEVIQDIHPKTCVTGDRVLFMVAKDVKVEGWVVIKKGANVVAEVAEAKEREYGGQAGRVIVTFRRLSAVDNQEIAVSGSTRREGDDKMIESIGLGLVCCPLFLLMKGEEGVIKAGQTCTIYTSQKTEVTVHDVRANE